MNRHLECGYFYSTNMAICTRLFLFDEIEYFLKSHKSNTFDKVVLFAVLRQLLVFNIL